MHTFARIHTYAQIRTHKSSLLSTVGLKYIILVIKIADVSTASHDSWISQAAVWIPGSAGQGQPANLLCDVMPLPDSG